jgi:polar amino acid transport system substrate-binding protein
MTFTTRVRHGLIATLVVAGLAALSACAQLGANPTGAASASGTALQATPDVRQALAPSGRLRVAVYPGSPTSWVKNPQTGQSAGIAFELGHALAQHLGVPVEIVTFARVAEILDALKAGQVDMTFTNATAVRAKDVDFTAPLVQLDLGLLVPPGSDIRRFADADQSSRRIGVSLGSSSQSALGQRLQHARVVTAPSLDAAQQLFKQGEIDAFATNKGILFEMSEKLPGYRVLDDRWGLENLAIAVPKGRDAGRAFLQNFAERLQRDGQLAAMAQRAGLRGLATP